MYESIRPKKNLASNSTKMRTTARQGKVNFEIPLKKKECVVEEKGKAVALKEWSR